MIGGVLSERSLVLNKSWVAIATTTVRNALSLVYSGAAQVITPETYETHGFESWASMSVREGDPCVRTISLHIPVPEVILLTRYNGVPSLEMTFTRRNLYRRDGNTCQYCGAKPGTSELTIDHVLPRSRGGLSTWENCVLACVRCNRVKANRLPKEAGLRLATEPVSPRWTPALEVPVGRVRSSWERFVSDRYWNSELER